MLETFKNSLPLTFKSLEEWLTQIISKLDSTYTINNDLVTTLYNTNVNTIVTNIVGLDTFNKIYNAINNGYELKVNNKISVVSSYCNSVDSDDYKTIVVDFIGVFSGTKLQRFRIEIENLGGSMRLCTKTIIDL